MIFFLVFMLYQPFTPLGEVSGNVRACVCVYLLAVELLFI